MTGIEPTWYYLHLKVVPSTALDGKNVDNEEIDLISWKTLVMAAVSNMYGLVGSASHFDVLHRQGLEAVIRIQPEDADKFSTALMGHAILFSTYVSSISARPNVEHEVPSAVEVVNRGPWLGAVMSKPLFA
ncbi:hypothetical protein DICA3_F28062 [Diutina catenulata]